MAQKEKKQTFYKTTLTKESLNDLEKEGKYYVLHWFDFIVLHLRRQFRRKPLELVVLFMLSFLGSVLISALVLLLILNKIELRFSLPTVPFLQTAGISLNSSGAQVSAYDPMALVHLIKKNDQTYVLVDVRSAKEFDEGHIKTAISIPVLGAEYLAANGEIKDGTLKEMFTSKIRNKSLVILYGQTQFSTYPESVATFLDQSGRRVKVLKIGWNEWAHFTNMWVPESSWNTFVIDPYIQVKE